MAVCLATHPAREGMTDIPSTITAAVRQGADGPRVHLGGAAAIARVVRLRRVVKAPATTTR
jgi:hypothetical protein